MPRICARKGIVCLAVIDMDLHFQQYGSGPPLVILHGLLGSSDNWISLARLFGEQFEVIAPDLRNHGRSPHSDSMSHVEMAKDVADLLRCRRLSNVAMIGHSLGGKVAMESALRFPNLIERLIVVDIAARAYEPRHGKLLQSLEELDLGALKNRTEAAAALEKSVPSLALRRFFLKNLAVCEKGGIEWRINLKGIRGSYPELTRGLERGRAFAGPAMMMRGGKSDYVMDEDIDDARALFPELEFETIDEAGHWVHAEAPEAFYRIASLFLGRDEDALTAP